MKQVVFWAGILMAISVSSAGIAQTAPTASPGSTPSTPSAPSPPQGPTTPGAPVTTGAVPPTNSAAPGAPAFGSGRGGGTQPSVAFTERDRKLQEQSQRIDRTIMRGICSGC